MGKDWVKALNEMAYTTGMSVDEMKSMLNEMGVEADVTTTTKTLKTKVPVYETTETMKSDYTYTNGRIDDNSERKFTTETKILDYKDVDGAVEVAQINMGKKNKGKAPTITYAGRSNPAPSSLTPSDSNSNSGKSSEKSSNTSAASHTHEVHRYSKEENTLKGLSA
jgi:hypothetical protein